MHRKPRIVIVGGGPAGLSAAFHLTSDPNWRDKIASITVYQLGWRLGGKGSTGRNMTHGARIEEHGIHGFCNFYFNSWRMISKVYATLDDRDRRDLPAKTIEDAFVGSSSSDYIQRHCRGWYRATIGMPRTDEAPWEERPARCREWTDILHGLASQHVRGGQTRNGSRARRWLADAIVSLLIRWGRRRKRLDVGSDTASPSRGGGLCGYLFDRLLDLTHARSYGTLHRLLVLVNVLWSIRRGLVRAKLWRDDFDLDQFDGEDFRTWLERHGVRKRALRSSLVATIPNVLFAFPDGDCTKSSTLSAASWLSWMLRACTGRGEYFYFMRAGTGETVILPLYLVLKKRGVRFEFFHKLERAVTNRDSTSNDLRIEQLIFERQAATTNGAEYDPLISVKVCGATFRAWPNEPCWDQLCNGEEDRKAGVDFEEWRHGSSTGRSAQERVLVYGAENDGFEHVVWAIPPSMIREVCDTEMQDAWKDVVECLPTTATQAVQVWLDSDTANLGWPRTGLAPDGRGRHVSGSFPDPLNDMAAFDDLLEFEAWPDDGPKGLVYFCGQMTNPKGALRTDHRTVVSTNAAGALDALPTFLPGFAKERVRDKYERFNVRPTEAYVQSPPGSVNGRRDAWESGLANVVMAGDWIYTGINVGAFESAVTGGKLAAFALRGGKLEEIVGYDFLHPRARARAKEAVADKRIPRIP